jgi:hypothetical protein
MRHPHSAVAISLTVRLLSSEPFGPLNSIHALRFLAALIEAARFVEGSLGGARRASATIAFFIPRCLAIFIAQALSHADEVIE